MKRPSMYTMPNRPRFVPVPRRDWLERTITNEGLPVPVMVDAATECHVTPPSVAHRMATYAGDLSGDVLEPSAGTGNLVRALRDCGCERLTMVEMHTALASKLEGAICADFLEWAATCEMRFDAIVMNPPFKRVRAHVAAARNLLKSSGRLVALVPVTFEDDEAEELERLPVDTFARAKVHTKIIGIET